MNVSVAQASGRWLATRGGLLTSARLATRGLNLVNLVLLTRLLDISRLGALFLLLNVAWVGALIARIGMDTAPVRLLAAAPSAARDIGRRSLELTLIGSAAVVLSASLGGWHLLGVAYGSVFSSIRLLAPTLVLLLANTCQGLLVGWLRGLTIMNTAALIEDLGPTTLWTVALVYLSAAHASPSLFNLLVIRAFAVIAVIPFGVFRLGPAVHRSAPLKESRARLASMGLYLLGGSLIANVIGTTSDLFVLGAFTTNAVVAVYAVAASLSAICALPYVAAATTIAPLIARASGAPSADTEAALRRLTGVLTCLTVALSAFIVAAGYLVVPSIFGPKYVSLGTYVAVLAAAQCVLVVTGPCGLTLIMTGHQRSSFWISMVSAVAGLTADILVVRPFGALGVATATSSALILDNLLAVILTKRQVGILTVAEFKLPGLTYMRRFVLATRRRAG